MKEKPKAEISIKQSKFLYRFLRTMPLQDLLSLYTSAISNNAELFKTLPEDLVNPTLENLGKIQSVVGFPEKAEKFDFDSHKILRNLRNLNGNELLSNYIFSLTDNPDAYSEISDEIRTSAEWWLDELRACVTGKNGLFSNEFDPETYVDMFVEFAGGERIIKILGSDVQTDNADYFFQQKGVILELKTLKTDFWESNAHKFKAIQNEFLRKSEITPEMILGISPNITREMFGAQFIVLRDVLQKITKKANKQIRNSKTLLNAEDAKGVVIFLIDGFYSVSPYLTIELIYEPVFRQYSAVDAIIFVNLRRKVTLDLGDGDYDYFIFEPRYKENPAESLSAFINQLGGLWFKYLYDLAGKKPDRSILSYNPRNLLNARWKSVERS